MTTESLLAALVARWAPPYHIRLAGKVQYILTAPLLEDNVTTVGVVFAGGDEAPVATSGPVADPDLTITLRGVEFSLLSADALDSVKAAMVGKLKLTTHTPQGMALAKALGKSYIRRP